MKVQAENLWPLIMDFVETYFGEDDLKSFIKYFSLDKVVKGDHRADPIVKHGGLQAMLACFLKNNKEALKEFKAHLSGGSQDAKKTKKPVNKKQESSSESESSESEEENGSSSESEEEKPVKKVVGKKRKAKESSSEESGSEDGSSDSEDDKKKVKKNGAPNKRQRADSISSRTRAHSDVKEEKPVKAAKPQVPPANFKF